MFSFMFVFDVVSTVMFASVTCSAYKYIRQARKTSPILPSGGVVRDHFRVHTYAVVGFLASGVSGTVFAALHTLSQNVLDWPPALVVEYGYGLSIIGMLLSAKAYVTHAIEEETPDNKFYMGDGK